MAAFLANFRNTMVVGVLLAIGMLIGFSVIYPGGPDQTYFEAVFRWMHVIFGILWIGLLYYFNFVQTRKMPDIPAELKPAISRYITPEALFWFRWSALFTVLAGVGIALLEQFNGENFAYAGKVFSFGLGGAPSPMDGGFLLMGVGIYLAIIMFLNVWAIIWPNQKILLGLREASDERKAQAAKWAGAASRINTLLSLPMLTSMAMFATLFHGGG
ncbi:MAG: urate hydroxylase PuuD [Caulobacteraceae bacterium]